MRVWSASLSEISCRFRVGGKEPLYVNKRKENKRLKCIQDLEAHNTDVVSIATNILESREKTG